MTMLRLFLILSFFSCTEKKPIQTPEQNKAAQELHAEAKDNFKPLEKYVSKNLKMVELGKKLYLDPRFSKSGTISCNSCHKLDNFGVDNEPTSPGHDGTRGDRNSPTTFNASYNFVQFWDGRAENLEAQALGPLLNPIEHGMKLEKDVLDKLKTPEYKALFKEAFNSDAAVTFKNIGVAIAEFEKTLVTTDRFDQYLKGDLQALNEQEQRGLKRFIEVGCTSCHYGASIGGQEYQMLGAVEPYQTEDLGRYKVTNKEEDKFMFKIPNLRNIAKTGPYFHDGSIKTLEEAIKLMGKHQLGEVLKDQDVQDIKAFLNSLTGKLQ